MCGLNDKKDKILLYLNDTNTAKENPIKNMSFSLALFYFTYYQRCHLRIVDSFGTEARFNMKVPGSRMKKNAYGFKQLDLKQYNTMFRKSLEIIFILFFLFKLLKLLKLLRNK